MIGVAIELLSPWLAAAALAMWCAPLLLLIAPAYRIGARRPRALDALWGVLLLGVINRMVSDFTSVPDELQHVSAIIIAALLTAVIWSYQRADS